MSASVLMMAHGSPDSLEEMEPYLRWVMSRDPSPEFVREMQDRYRTFGGRSPLLDITRAQAAALERRLGIPVHVGMRTWKPFIADVLAEIEADPLVALPMTPFYSEVSTAKYREALPATARFIERWHDEPAFLDAWAGRIDARDPLLFTAHSVPVRAAEPYRSQIFEAIAGILRRIGPAEWDFAWQSRPNAPGEWLTPDVDAVLRSRKWKSVLVVPVGFVCDHAEVLYDLDVLHRRTADGLGMAWRRAEMLNDSPLLIDALENAVRKVLP